MRDGSNAVVFEIRGLTVGYGQRLLVRDLEASLDRGAVVAVMGPNASGNSTLLKTLGGLIPALGGSTRGSTALMLQVPESFGSLTVADCASLASEQRGWDLVTKDMHDLGLAGGRIRDDLSYAYRRCCDLLMAVYRSPNCLLLDEPHAGLSETRLDWMKRRISEALDEGEVGSVMFSCQESEIPFLKPTAVIRVGELFSI